jgi:uncharacterized protein (DUF362 family)
LKLEENKIALISVGEDVGDAVFSGVKLLGGLELQRNESIVIKPNICNAKNPYGMVDTDFRVVEAVIEIVKKRTENITVVESNNVSGSAEKRLIKSGMLNKLKEAGVQFLNLSNDEYEIHEVAGRKLELPKTVLDAERFINIPKMKTCGHTLVTLSIKNLFGVLRQAKKNRLHSRLDEILPYLVKTIRHDLIVVDGIVAMEGNGPVIGTPKKMNILVTGVNPVAVDSICSRIMGFEPSDISHILKSHEMGLGEIGDGKIEVLGEDWTKHTQDFEKPYSLKASLRSVKTISKIYL